MYWPIYFCFQAVLLDWPTPIGEDISENGNEPKTAAGEPIKTAESENPKDPKDKDISSSEIDDNDKVNNGDEMKTIDSLESSCNDMDTGSQILDQKQNHVSS